MGPELQRNILLHGVDGTRGHFMTLLNPKLTGLPAAHSLPRLNRCDERLVRSCLREGWRVL